MISYLWTVYIIVGILVMLFVSWKALFAGIKEGWKSGLFVASGTIVLWPIITLLYYVLNRENEHKS